MSRKTRSHFGKQIKRVMLRTATWLQAEKLPSYLPYFINRDLLDHMYNNSNQLIRGRRGSGKTHLLGAFKEYVNENEDSSCAIYISMVGIAGTPINTKFEAEAFSVTRHTGLLFRRFVKALVDNLIESIDMYICMRNGSTSFFDSEFAKNRYDSEVLTLLNMVEVGSSFVTGKDVDERQVIREDKIKGKGLGLGVDISLNNPLLGGFGKKENTTAKQSSKEIINKIEQTVFIDLVEIRKQIEDILNILGIEVLHILIDEWVELDKNMSRKIQPYFAQLLKDLLFNSNKFAVKIATLWDYTQLYDRNLMSKSRGLELGEDIHLDIDLDTKFMDSMEKISHFLKNIIFRRLAMEIEALRELEENGTIKDFFLQELFDDPKNFNVLVLGSHGIPRDFLELFDRCSREIGHDYEHNAINARIIRDNTQAIYLYEKRSRIDQESAAQQVWNKINGYMNETGKRIFIVDLEESNQLLSLSKLCDEEVIHPLSESITPRNLRNKFRVYIIDYGNYIDWCKYQKMDLNRLEQEKMFPQFSLMTEDDIEKHLISFLDIDEEYIICKNCGKHVNKRHPVYLKCKVCPKCADSLYQ